MRFLVIVALTGALCGCVGPGYISADAIDGPLRGVVKRHAAYTAADETISPLKQRTNARDGELLLKALDEAQATKEE